MGAVKVFSVVLAFLLLCYFVGSIPPAEKEPVFVTLNAISAPTQLFTPTPTLNEPKNPETFNMTDTNQSPVPNGWTTSYTGMINGVGGVSNVVHDTTVLHNGNSSIRIDPYTGAENTQREANSYYLPISPGDVIRFSLYMKVSAAAVGETQLGARFGVDFYGALGRLTGAQTPTGGTWTPPNNWPADEADQYVTWGSDWTLRVMEFTVADTYPADPWAAEAYTEGQYYTPTAIIPWLQVYSSANGGQGWFADVELIINPTESGSIPVYVSALMIQRR